VRSERNDLILNLTISEVSLKRKVLFVFGTRPETIKLAPLIQYFKDNSASVTSLVAVTGQHKEMLDQALNLFELEPDFNFSLMQPNQTLSSLTALILEETSRILSEEKPDLLIVQGDTTTTYASSLAAFYQNIPVAHIEAGLRSHNNFSPYPEEINRKIVGILSTYHFPPTEIAKQNLIEEKIDTEFILTSGNTVIDALNYISNRLENKDKQNFYKSLFSKNYGIIFESDVKTILITGHRRESFGKGFQNICSAIESIATRNPELQIIYPVHLNPNVQRPVFNILNNCKNVFLIEPQEYEAFVFLMNKSYLILTDSGGIQEEAPSLGKPVLVMRENTERLEGLESNTAILVGTNPKQILDVTEQLIQDKSIYEKMSNATNPYGDGKASKYIFDFLMERI